VFRPEHTPKAWLQANDMVSHSLHYNLHFNLITGFNILVTCSDCFLWPSCSSLRAALVDFTDIKVARQLIWWHASAACKSPTAPHTLTTTWDSHSSFRLLHFPRISCFKWLFISHSYKLCANINWPPSRRILGPFLTEHFSPQ